MAFWGYPLVSLSDARSERDEAWTILSEGRDRGVARKLKVEANLEASRQTFERVARQWHANAKAEWAKRHANDVMRSLERDVFLTIGQLPIADLTPPLVLAALREIESRGSIETAKRVLQRISCVFGFAIAEGLVKADPSERLGAALKPLRRGRQPAILELSPLKKMILAAEEEHARPVTRLGLRFLALTAVRPSELRGARWDEFEDLNGSEPLWRIPAARMKGDLDRKEELGGDHLVPLTPQAVTVLKALWPLSGDGPRRRRKDWRDLTQVRDSWAGYASSVQEFSNVMGVPIDDLAEIRALLARQRIWSSGLACVNYTLIRLLGKRAVADALKGLHVHAVSAPIF